MKSHFEGSMPLMGRICMLGVLALFMLGCSSGEPSISGFGFGSSRTVTVGDTFEIRLPVAENGARLWQITSYDSLFLTLASNTRAEATSPGSGSSEIVIPILARQSGETTIEVTQRISGQDRLAGRIPKVKQFHIRITP